MRKFVLIFVAALALGGCNTTGSNWGAITAGVAAFENAQVTQQQVDVAYVAWKSGFLVPATAYVSLPRCAPGTKISFRNQCSDPATIRKIQAAIVAMRANFAKVQALLAQGASGAGLQTAWAAVTAGISTYQTLAASFT